MVRLRLLIWVPWWITELLIVVEAQEGEGDWILAVFLNGALATVGTERDGEAQVYSPEKELGPGQQQQEWKVKFRPGKAAISRICNHAW